MFEATAAITAITAITVAATSASTTASFASFLKTVAIVVSFFGVASGSGPEPWVAYCSIGT